MLAFLDQEVVGRAVRTQPKKGAPAAAEEEEEARARPVGAATCKGSGETALLQLSVTSRKRISRMTTPLLT